MSGLVGYWNLNESSGTSAADSSGNGNTGTLVNAPTWTTGQVNGALQFDGIDGNARSVDISNSASLDISGTALTIAMWVNITNDTGDQVVIVKPWLSTSWGGSDYQYGLEYDLGSEYKFYFGSTGGIQGPFSMTASPGTWQHVAYTYDGTDVRGYLNGMQQLVTSVAKSIEARGYPLRLGLDQTGGQATHGLIDEVFIYNRALSAQEVADLYNGYAGCQ